jgi:hypothetical protein
MFLEPVGFLGFGHQDCPVPESREVGQFRVGNPRGKRGTPEGGLVGSRLVKESNRRGWLLGAVVIGTLLVGAALVWAAWTKTSAPHDDFWIQVGGAGLQVGLVSVMGTILAGALGWLDARRQNRRRLDERRLRIFDDLVGGYNQVKAVRRNLRALGLRQPPEKLSGGQVDGLRAQMMQLVDAQLSFEAIWRELNTNSAAFRDPRSMLSQITTVEKYLHAIIQEWETAGGGIWSGAPGKRVEDLRRLQAFIGNKTEFKEQASKRLRKVQDVVRQELAGRDLVTLEHEDEIDD